MSKDFFKSPKQPSVVQCEHGFHHSSAPHSCDWREDDQCLYEALQEIAADDSERREPE